MCGFAGIFNYLRRSEVNKKIIATMTNAIQHRGPDDSGVFVDGDIGLGFARLSIIDPLDGSSNIDVNVSVGTIFSVFRRVTPVGTPVLEGEEASPALSPSVS